MQIKKEKLHQKYLRREEKQSRAVIILKGMQELKTPWPVAVCSRTSKSDSHPADPASTIVLRGLCGANSMEKFHAHVVPMLVCVVWCGGTTALCSTGGVELPVLQATKVKGWEMPGQSRIWALWKLLLPLWTFFKAQWIQIVPRRISRGRKCFVLSHGNVWGANSFGTGKRNAVEAKRGS